MDNTSANRSSYRIVPLAAPHRQQWESLVADYADFYRTALAPNTPDTLWQWINNGALFALVAIDADDNLCGFAHWEIMLRPLSGGKRAYLHDIFVLPSTRGGGVGKALITAAADAANVADCQTLRWATAADNINAQHLYDKIADKTSWVIYDKTL